MASSGTHAHPLVGTWKLVSAGFAGAPLPEVYGPEPKGWLVLTESGRLMAMIDGPDGLMSYTGAYRLEGEGRFVTRVDLAWMPAWLETDQVRIWRIEGEELFVETEDQPHPQHPDQMGRYAITWSRQ